MTYPREGSNIGAYKRAPRGVLKIPNMRLIQYLKDTQSELKHVSWPTRKQAIIFTSIVVVVSVATAAYLGAFDWLFTWIVESFVI